MVTKGHLPVGLEAAWPSGVRTGLGIPIKSVFSVSRPRRCQADLGGIFPWRATAGTTGRGAGFGEGPPATGACWKTGMSAEGVSLWDQNWGPQLRDFEGERE